METPSDKIVFLIHMGDGRVSFKVPALADVSEVRLKYRNEDKHKDLSAFRHSLFRSCGAFYMELLKEGFVRKGAVSLNGCFPSVPENDKDRPLFRTVVQADGDVICSIERSILEDKKAEELLTCYSEVQRQFIEAFHKALRIKIRRVIATVGGCITLGAIIIQILKFTFS
ncbi:MAG: hypothetical protein BA865_11525 [Desulfobacterales bacterium S5133MH4]|nr:MAG: hypothetical protein BA865_11525 [Desulfobacterales bacterium S5133MH4]